MQTLDLCIAPPAVARATEYTVSYVECLLPLVKEDPQMIVVMRANATKQNIDAILDRLSEHQLKGHLVYGEERGLNAPPRSMVAPASRAARAVVIICSSLSTAHGPAITTTAPPPTLTPRTSTIVSGGWNSRAASL